MIGRHALRRAKDRAVDQLVVQAFELGWVRACDRAAEAVSAAGEFAATAYGTDTARGEGHASQARLDAERIQMVRAEAGTRAERVRYERVMARRRRNTAGRS